VDNAYANVGVYDGKYLLIASMLFAIQIYCDFAGYSTIAIGAAEVMGFQLMDNFNSPYLSQSVAGWKRTLLGAGATCV
jgi:alginate O-acetyltransferase complex protein AlgI